MIIRYYTALQPMLVGLSLLVLISSALGASHDLRADDPGQRTRLYCPKSRRIRRFPAAISIWPTAIPRVWSFWCHTTGALPGLPRSWIRLVSCRGS